MKHWASSLIGKPWKAGGEDPASGVDCWGLVRHVFRERHDIEMPVVYLGDPRDGDNVAAIKRAAQVSGFRRADPPCQDGDIVLMDGPDGRHVGVVINTIRGLRFLHSSGHETERGPTGSVVAEQIPDVLKRYGHPEIWRRS